MANSLSRRAFLQGAATLVGTGMLAACTQVAVTPSATTGAAEGDAAPAAAPATVLWWFSHSGTVGELLQRFAADYTAANEGVTIQAEYQGSYIDHMNKLIVSAAADVLPDLIHIGDGQYLQLALAGLLHPLNELLEGAEGIDLSTYYKPVERGNWEGTYYQLAYGLSTPIFYYNKEALESAGLDGAPETWTDFYETYLPALTNDSQAGFSFNPDYWWLQSALWTSGVMVDDSNLEIDYANPLIVAWYEKMQEARRTGQALYPASAEENAMQMFAAQRAPMAINSTGSIVSVDDLTQGAFTTEVGYLPAGDAGRFTPHGGNGLSISARASDANRDAAWAFIKYLHEPANFAEYDIATGYVPLNEATAAELADVIAADPRRQVAIDQLEWARWHIKSHNVSARTLAATRDAWYEAVQLDIDVQERFDKLQTEAYDILTEEGWEPVLP